MMEHGTRQPTPDDQSALQLSLRRRLLGGGAWALGGRIAYLITTIGIGALVTRLLSPEGAGTYFVAISLATSLAVVAECGLRKVMVRLVASSVAANEGGRARKATIRVLVIGGVSAASVGIVVASDLGRWVLSSVFTLTDVAAVAPAIGLLVTVRAVGILRSEAYRGLQDFRLASLFDSVDAQILTAASLLGVALVVPTAASLEIVLWLTVLAWLPGLVAGGLYLRRRLRDLRGPGAVRTGEIAHGAWPLWLQETGQMLLTQVDLWIVAALLGAADAALYGVARRLIAIVGFPLLIINAVLPPILAELATQRRWRRFERVLRSSATVTFVPALLVTLLLIIVGGPLLTVGFGDFYGAAWPVLAILCVGQVVKVWVGSCSLALIMSANERAIMLVSLGSAAVMAVAAALVARPFGIVGVAIASACAISLKHLLSWSLARRRLGVWTHGSLGEARELWTGFRNYQTRRRGLLRRD